MVFFWSTPSYVWNAHKVTARAIYLCCDATIPWAIVWWYNSTQSYTLYPLHRVTNISAALMSWKVFHFCAATTSRPCRNACRCRPCWHGPRANFRRRAWRRVSLRCTFLSAPSHSCERNTSLSTTPSGSGTARKATSASGGGTANVLAFCSWSGLGAFWRTWIVWQV